MPADESTVGLFRRVVRPVPPASVHRDAVERKVELTLTTQSELSHDELVDAICRMLGHRGEVASVTRWPRWLSVIEIDAVYYPNEEE